MLLIECGGQHLAERSYALELLLGEFLGLEHRFRPADVEDVVIRSADDEGDRRLVVADSLFATHDDLLAEDALPRLPLDACPRSELDGALVLGDLPVLYGSRPPGGPFVTREGEELRVGIDLFGGAFVLLTRLEEAVIPERDGHGRFPSASSLPVRAGFSGRPLVDEYTEVLWWALAQLWPRLHRRPRAFTARPTHDVDWPFYSRGRVWESVRAAAADVRNRRGVSLARARIESLYRVKRSGRDADPANVFDFLMTTSEQHGLRSAFYFMGGHASSAYDPGYSLDDRWLRELMHTVDARGHEIGVHPSYTTFRDGERLATELERVREAARAAGVRTEVTGGRQHFLRFENPGTWRNWDGAGLDYDSTLGYAETCGFRCGTCRAYRVFDLQERRALRLVERPLVAMETALLTYQGLSPEAAADEMLRLAEVCRRFEGEFTFLWHNNRLATPPERAAYARVVAGAASAS